MWIQLATSVMYILSGLTTVECLHCYKCEWYLSPSASVASIAACSHGTHLPASAVEICRGSTDKCQIVKTYSQQSGGLVFAQRGCVTPSDERCDATTIADGHVVEYRCCNDAELCNGMGDGVVQYTTPSTTTPGVSDITTPAAATTKELRWKLVIGSGARGTLLFSQLTTLLASVFIGKYMTDYM